MNLSADAIRSGPKSGTTSNPIMRSPILNHFRTNPFRVLRIPVNTPAEEAVWKAEEMISLERAGLPPANSELLPWLPGVEEYEIHQSVQVVEEPFRRLTQQLLFFDLVHDARRQLLEDALVAVDSDLVARYLALAVKLQPPVVQSERGSPAVQSPTPQSEKKTDVELCRCPNCDMRVQPKSDGTCPSCQAALPKPDSAAVSGKVDLDLIECSKCQMRVKPKSDGTCPSCQADLPKVKSPESANPEPAAAVPETPPVEVQLALPPPADDATMSRVALAINQCNLRLMTAAMAMNRSESGCSPVQAGSDAQLDWKAGVGGRFVSEIHKQIAQRFDDSARAKQIEALWTAAVSGWYQILSSPDFLAYLLRMIDDLNDDMLTSDDLETIVNAVRSMLTDFLVGEIKIQIIDGRHDRVTLLLSAVAHSEIETRDWVVAFRPLRQLFETELKETEALLKKNQATLRVRDLEVYLERLQVVAENWKQIDQGQLLGLGHLIDDRVRWTFGSLKSYVDFATLEDLKPLLSRASDLAASNSLRKQIQSFVATIIENTEWACYFCKIREAVFDRSVVVKGKKETNRVYHGNGYTIYYSIQPTVVPRCERCAKYHRFLSWTSHLVWLALLPAFAWFQYAIWNMYREEEWFWRAAPALLVYGIAGWMTGELLGLYMTPSGERKRSNCSMSPQCERLRKEGYAIDSTNYSYDAVKSLKG